MMVNVLIFHVSRQLAKAEARKPDRDAVE